MKLYNLGKIPWQETQLIYHALAYLGRESLVLVSPASPYVCIGYHQDVTHEIDIDFCKENNIPIFRREVGGGAVFLDGGQLFFHLILREDNPAIPASKKAFYQKFLQPIVNVHHRIDIAAEYKPVNDIIVNNRKISGTGVGEIGECVVFVGNLILDFDYKMMSRVLKVPDEKFRDKVRKTIEDNLTTIHRELDENEITRWGEAKLNALMAEEFGELLGTFEPCQKDDALISKMEALGSQMIDDAWLFRKGKPSSLRSVKIRSGVEVKHKMHKAIGGLIRADFEMRDDRMSHVSISGDFFCYPEDAIAQLESLLEGTAAADVHKVLTRFCSRRDIEIPSVGYNDWMSVFSK
jgi:lipoate-protein ligase A